MTEEGSGETVKGRDLSEGSSLRQTVACDETTRTLSLWQDRTCLDVEDKHPSLALSCSLPDQRLPCRPLDSTGHFLPSLSGPLPVHLYGDARVTPGFRPQSLPQRRLSCSPKSEELIPHVTEALITSTPTSLSLSNFGPATPILPDYGLPNATDPSSSTIDTVDDLGSTTDQGSASPPVNTECVVCGDKSSGKHYGQFTCEGCKSFFKRSVRRNLTYTCRGTRQCPVDMQHRNQCQYCRFQKCLKLGMRREAVQKGRVPPTNVIMYQQHLGCALGSWQHVSDNNSLPMLSNYCLSGFVTSLVKADSYCASRFSVAGEGEHFGHLLIGIVEWAKKIPHFPDLALCDQVSLLKTGWQELFLITAAQVGLPMPVGQMVSSCLPPDNDRSLVMVQLQDLNRMLQQQLEKLQKLQLDPAEYACLKAIVLFNPDANSLSNGLLVDSVQERVQCALLEYVHSHHPNQAARFGRILLRIPTLRKIASHLIDALCSMRLLNNVTIESLVQSFLQQPSPCGAEPSPAAAPLASPCVAAVATGGHVPSSVAMATHHVNPRSAWLAGLDAMGPQIPGTAQQGLANLTNIGHHPQL